MTLFSSLSIATSGLLAIQGQINVVSQNVSNANTAGYTEETAADTALEAGDDLSGVSIGTITRVTSAALQTSLFAQNSAVSAATTLSTAWSGIVDALGQTSSDSGSTGSLTQSLSGLQTAFTALDGSATSPVDQAAAVTAGQDVAGSFNDLAAKLTSARQDAENGIGTAIGSANAALAAIGSTSAEIVRMQAEGQSTAGLQDQRDAAMTTLSNIMDVKFTATSAGNMLVSTPNGIILPTDASGGAMSTTMPTLRASDAYPGAIPGIMLNGIDITTSISGGTLGANIALRDTDIPTAQANLDSLAASVAQRFSAQGLDMFTDDAGHVVGTGTTTPPPNGIVGYAASMQVNPAIVANSSLTASGTGAQLGGAYSVANIVTYAFGANSSSGVAQPAAASTGLGPDGNLSLSYAGTGSLFDLAASLSGAWGSRADTVSGQQTNSTASQTSISSALSNVAGVSVDTEMSKMVALENSYGANAKVISAVQTMFSSILDAVDPA